jgi:hypothetical protein
VFAFDDLLLGLIVSQIQTEGMFNLFNDAEMEMEGVRQASPILTLRLKRVPEPAFRLGLGLEGSENGRLYQGRVLEALWFQVSLRGASLEMAHSIHRVDNVAKLKRHITQTLGTIQLSEDYFADFYKFLFAYVSRPSKKAPKLIHFRYCLEEGQKTMPMDVSRSLSSLQEST